MSKIEIGIVSSLSMASMVLIGGSMAMFTNFFDNVLMMIKANTMVIDR